MSVRFPVTTQPASTILLVEDEQQIRDFIKNLLQRDGFEVLDAGDGAEGYDIGAEYPGKIDLLLSDMLLPELSGYDLAVKLLERRPDLKVLFMTGYVEGEIVQRCVAELNASFLDKPFQPADLRARVRQALSAAGSTR